MASRPEAAPVDAETKPTGAETNDAPTACPVDGLRISDAASAMGVSTRTLRYYEELGLLEPSGHTAGGERRYHDADLVRLQRILELKTLIGMNLEEIKRFLDIEARLAELRAAYFQSRENPTPAARASQRAILVEALELREDLTVQLDAKLAHMDEFRAKLAEDAGRVRQLLAELDTEGG